MGANNNCNFVGRVGRDPEERYTPGGILISSFSLAVTNPFGKDDKTKTDWVDFDFMGKRAESVAKLIHKGDMLAVSGRLRVSKYEKDGKSLRSYSISGDDWQFCGGSSSAPTNGSTTKKAAAGESNGWEDAADSGF